MGRDAVQMRLNLEDLCPLAPPSIVTATRPVTREDSRHVGVLLHRAYRGTVDDDGETELDARREAADTFAGKYGDVSWTASLVAEIDTVVASSSLITLWRAMPLLAFSVTLPQYQNNGLGGHLISRSAELLRDEGYRELRLVVTRANPAITLYRRLGFVNDDHRPG